LSIPREREEGKRDKKYVQFSHEPKAISLCSQLSRQGKINLTQCISRELATNTNTINS
jgi:hypothetical protein